MIRQFVIASLVAAGAFAGCTQVVRHPATPTPSTGFAPEPARPASLAAVARVPHKPLHKGYADLSTGLYIREDDDLVVNTAMPIILRRTYNSGDGGHSRQFGIDATHTGEWWIYGDSDPRIPWGDLILADGARIHFTRISPGDRQEGAVLRHDSTPTEFNGALLSWNGSRWEMRFRDGALAVFLDCQGPRETCSLVERRDPEGHRIGYVRDAAGMLLSMESEGQSISFDYDDHKRIVRAYDFAQHDMRYTYDDRGRLVRATASDGIVRTYQYDEKNHLVGVREPGRILQNWFDESGRWAKQVVKDSEQDDDPYVATVRYVVEGGSIVETHFDEGYGLEVDRYNGSHHIISETLDADGRAPIVFTYKRDPDSNAATGVTMSCRGPSGSVTRTVQLASPSDKKTKAALIRENCLLPR